METYMVDGWMVSLDSLSLNIRIDFLFVRVPTFFLEFGWVGWVRGYITFIIVGFEDAPDPISVHNEFSVRRWTKTEDRRRRGFKW